MVENELIQELLLVQIQVFQKKRKKSEFLHRRCSNTTTASTELWLLDTHFPVPSSLAHPTLSLLPWVLRLVTSVWWWILHHVIKVWSPSREERDIDLHGFFLLTLGPTLVFLCLVTCLYPVFSPPGCRSMVHAGFLSTGYFTRVGHLFFALFGTPKPFLPSSKPAVIPGLSGLQCQLGAHLLPLMPSSMPHPVSSLLKPHDVLPATCFSARHRYVEVINVSLSTEQRLSAALCLGAEPRLHRVAKEP